MSEGGSDRQVKRFQLLIELFGLFADQYKKSLGPSEELSLNYVQLYNVVESYFQDVDRYKQFHFRAPEGSLINDAKKAALTLKWLVRVTPVYVHNPFTIQDDTVDSFNYDDFSIIMNELFSIFVAECFLHVALGESKLGELLYLLRYRSPDEYTLMAVFQLIMDMRDGDAVILS